MRVLGSGSDEEFVAVFLRGEIASPRYRETVLAELDRRGLDRALVDTPHLESDLENNQRAAVLLAYRPLIVDDDVFGHWPPDVDWQSVEFDLDEVGNFHFLTYSYWDELSSGTHLVRDGAESVRAGRVVFGVHNDMFWQIAQSIDAGKQLPPLIALDRGPDLRPLLIEGHNRATGLLLAMNPPTTIKALLAIRR